VPVLVFALSAYLIANSLIRLDYQTEDAKRYQDRPTYSYGTWLLSRSGHHAGRNFIPIWVVEAHDEIAKDVRRPLNASLNSTAPKSVEIVPTRSNLLLQRYQITTSQAFRLLFHQFYFPPWRVTVDGILSDVQPATDLGLVSVTIPPGTHSVELAWRAARSVWLGRILAAIGWIVVLLFLLPSQSITTIGTYRSRWPLCVWLVVGVLGLMTASGITTRTWDVAAVGADYGSIRLEGVGSIPPTRAGEVVPVRLTWSVRGRGNPLKAFVHLTDDTGAVIAQYDGSPGGAYTRYPPWTPLAILQSTHYIPIPAALSPGRYRLLAGLYSPDRPLEPLMPEGADNPRIEIGVAEVLP